MNYLTGGCGEGNVEFHSERTGDKWDKLEKDKVQWSTRLSLLNLSHWNPEVLFILLTASHFSEWDRYQNPSEIFERLLFNLCLLRVSWLHAPDSTLPLPWLLHCALAVYYSYKVWLHFFTDWCSGFGDSCFTKYNIFVCFFSRPLVLVGPWCWSGWGLRWSLCPLWTLLCGRWISGGYSATATRESRGGWADVSPSLSLRNSYFPQGEGHGKNCFSLQLVKPHVTLKCECCSAESLTGVSWILCLGSWMSPTLQT